MIYLVEKKTLRKENPKMRKSTSSLKRELKFLVISFKKLYKTTLNATRVLYLSKLLFTGTVLVVQLSNKNVEKKRFLKF